MKQVFNYIFCGSLLFLTVACGRSGQLTMPETEISTQPTVEAPVIDDGVTDDAAATEIVEASPAAEDDGLQLQPAQPKQITPVEPNLQVSTPIQVSGVQQITTVLELAHQKYAEQFGLDLQAVKDSWTSNMGDLQTADVKSTEDFNKFFQFVRETGGTAFAVNNDAAASFNDTAHGHLQAAISNKDASSLAAIKTNLEFQTTSVQWINQRISEVASIYGIRLGAVDSNLVVFNLMAKTFADPIGDRLKAALPSSANDQQILEIRQLLKGLLGLSSFHVNMEGTDLKSGNYLSFLSFSLLEKDADGNWPLVLDGFRVDNRVYGAVATITLRFVEK